MAMIVRATHITSEQDSALKEIYKDTGVRPAESIRRAINEYLEKRTRQSVRTHLAGPCKE